MPWELENTGLSPLYSHKDLENFQPPPLWRARERGTEWSYSFDIGLGLEKIKMPRSWAGCDRKSSVSELLVMTQPFPFLKPRVSVKA